MESILVPILTFLLGAVATAFGFTLALSNRVSKVEVKIDTHIGSVGGCPLHAAVAADAAVAKSKVEEDERRLLNLEKTTR